MKRVLLLAIASCGLLAIAPATSLAHSRHHHARHHQRHHARRHIRKFGDVHGTSGTTGSGTTSTGPAAGTVTSFTNGVLTITLADGESVSGTVTNDTEIECMSSSSSSGSMGDDFRTDGGGWGDSVGSGGGDQGEQNDQGDDNGDRGDDNGDQGDDDDAQACDMSALTQAASTHASVQDAVLLLTGAGATWKRVDLS